MTDESLEILRTNTTEKSRTIRGCPNYEILSNVRYAEKFQFQSMDLRFDDNDNDISDCVTRALYVSPHNHTEEIANVHKHIHEHLSQQRSKQLLADHLV